MFVVENGVRSMHVRYYENMSCCFVGVWLLAKCSGGFRRFNEVTFLYDCSSYIYYASVKPAASFESRSRYIESTDSNKISMVVHTALSTSENN